MGSPSIGKGSRPRGLGSVTGLPRLTWLSRMVALLLHGLVVVDTGATTLEGGLHGRLFDE
jgi:hypothetical protein